MVVILIDFERILLVGLAACIKCNLRCRLCLFHEISPNPQSCAAVRIGPTSVSGAGQSTMGISVFRWSPGQPITVFSIHKSNCEILNSDAAILFVLREVPGDRMNNN